jgi:hypothetical protein
MLFLSHSSRILIGLAGILIGLVAFVGPFWLVQEMTSNPKLTLCIQMPKDDYFIGEEIPVAFKVNNVGNCDVRFMCDDSGTTESMPGTRRDFHVGYQSKWYIDAQPGISDPGIFTGEIEAKVERGKELLPDKTCISSRENASRIMCFQGPANFYLAHLRPGEGFVKTITLNNRVKLDKPGRYCVSGTYHSFKTVASQPALEETIEGLGLSWLTGHQCTAVSEPLYFVVRERPALTRPRCPAPDRAEAELVGKLNHKLWTWWNPPHEPSKVEPHPIVIGHNSAASLRFDAHQIEFWNESGVLQKAAYRVKMTRSNGGWIFLDNGSAIGFTLVSPTCLFLAGVEFKATTGSAEQNEHSVDGETQIVRSGSKFEQLCGKRWVIYNDMAGDESSSAMYIEFLPDGTLIRRNDNEIVSKSRWSIVRSGFNGSIKTEIVEHDDKTMRRKLQVSYTGEYDELDTLSLNDQFSLDDQLYRLDNAATRRLGMERWCHSADTDPGTEARLTYNRPIGAGALVKFQFELFINTSDPHWNPYWTERTIPKKLQVRCGDSLQEVSLLPAVSAPWPPITHVEKRTGNFEIVLNKKEPTTITIFIPDSELSKNPAHAYLPKSWSVTFQP